ncbi:hypothetical protein AB6A40_003704 [Gnathostoma spinigerum]|uniref:Uncharacterized protein n=1 Tax=Gnathostoma spinigerum TaxID=75299 RepID=A0ABD6EL48_9BILA
MISFAILTLFSIPSKDPLNVEEVGHKVIFSPEEGKYQHPVYPSKPDVLHHFSRPSPLIPQGKTLLQPESDSTLSESEMQAQGNDSEENLLEAAKLGCEGLFKLNLSQPNGIVDEFELYYHLAICLKNNDWKNFSEQQRKEWVAFTKTVFAKAWRIALWEPFGPPRKHGILLGNQYGDFLNDIVGDRYEACRVYLNTLGMTMARWSIAHKDDAAMFIELRDKVKRIGCAIV